VTAFAELTTIGVGGPIADLVTAESDQDIADAMAEDAFILGGGSNLVVGDGPFDRRVIRIATRGLEVQPDGDRVIVEAAAGEPWDELVAFTVDQGWSGLEFLSGIPGLVGASPIQNVGAYGQEVSAVASYVSVLDRLTGEVDGLPGSACGFGYRTSRFKREPDRWVVLAVSFTLRPGAQSPVGYAELAKALGIAPGQAASAPAIREAVLGLRRSKAMVLDPGDPDTRSAGSFFLNPVVEPGIAESLPDCPRYPAGERVKLSAAWLIEQAGVHRGWTLPHGPKRVRISTKHTLAIANADRGTAGEVLALASQVQNRVLQAFGIRLQPEPTLLNCRLDDE
jgi:UDP-N-acetylmuramate dehydrogenase